MECSFCNLDQSEIKYLIAGKAVNICNECIDVCNEIILQAKMTKVQFNVITTIKAVDPLKPQS